MTAPTLPESDAPDRNFTRLVGAVRANRVLADILWQFADENGCFCLVKRLPTHSRRCADAATALLMALEAE